MRRPLLVFIGLGVLAIVIAAAVLRYRSAQAKSLAERAAAEEPRSTDVVALGTLEPHGGIIQVSGTVGERLASIDVQAGAKVEQAQALAKLESYPMRQTQLEVAELSLQEAKRRKNLEQQYGDSLVAQAQLGIEQLSLEKLDIDAQQAKLNLLKADLAIAQRDLERMAGLDDTIVSPQQRDHQKLVVEQAQAELASAEAMLAKSRAGSAFSKREAESKLTAAEIGRDRLLAAIDVPGLEKSVKLAKDQLELSIVRAPLAGQVLDIISHVGETIGQQPILTMGDTAQMYAVAEVYESQVRQVRPGQRARITSEALERPLTGTVEHVGTLVARNQVMSLSPTSSSDLRVVKVQVRLDPNDQAARLVNLQVTVTIDTSAVGAPPAKSADQAPAKPAASGEPAPAAPSTP